MTTMWPAFMNGLMTSAPGSISRRFPTFWSDNEGGIDFGAPPGTPVIALADGPIVGAGYFDNARGNWRMTTDDGADHGVVTQRVTNQDGTQTDLYYQHIAINPAIRFCFDGVASCGGQQVKKGDVIGYITDWGMLEMGVNVGNSTGGPKGSAHWGTIWGADPNPGPHVDPEPYLRALASGQNTTGTIPGSGIGGGSFLGMDFTPLLQAVPGIGIKIGIFLLALVLVGFGFYLLFQKQADALVGKSVKLAAKAALA